MPTNSELVSQLRDQAVGRSLKPNEVEFSELVSPLQAGEVICAITTREGKDVVIVVTDCYQQRLLLDLRATWYAIPQELADQIEYSTISIASQGSYFFFNTHLPYEVRLLITRPNSESITFIVAIDPGYFVVKLVPLERIRHSADEEQVAVKRGLLLIWRALKIFGVISPQADMPELLPAQVPLLAWHRYMLEWNPSTGPLQRIVDTLDEAVLEIRLLREQGISTKITLSLILEIQPPS